MPTSSLCIHANHPVDIRDAKMRRDGEADRHHCVSFAEQDLKINVRRIVHSSSVYISAVIFFFFKKKPNRHGLDQTIQSAFRTGESKI